MAEILLPTGLRAVEMGRSSAFPTIGCHGWLDNSLSFAGLGPLLQHNHIVSLDMGGHGHSQHRGEGAEYNFVDWVPDVINTVDHLRWQKFGMIGHSMGCGVATLVAGCAPDRLAFLVLLDGVGPLVSKPEENPERVMRRIAASSRLRKKTGPKYVSVEEALEARYRAGEFDVKENLRPMVERNLIKVGDQWQWGYDPRLKLPSSIRLTAEQVEAFLVRITCPVLILEASDGLPIVKSAISRFGGYFSNLTVKKVSGRHHAHLDHPERVAQMINDFMKSLGLSEPEQ